MLSLQKNLSDHNVMGRSLYETLFVWNEFLTRGIRNSLQNTSWTVALVYGFFKQVIPILHSSKFFLVCKVKLYGAAVIKPILLSIFFFGVFFLTSVHFMVSHVGWLPFFTGFSEHFKP
jgi:hypothetical protein